MEADTKVISIMECEVVEENFITSKEVFMMANGKIIICTEKENYTILISNLLTKDSGIWINFMVEAKFTTMSLLF